MSDQSKCGFVAIIGRPNVGKSTLLNALLQTKLAITSKKAQTTRHNIVGIKTEGMSQTVYVDTPGFRHMTKQVLHQYLNRIASGVVTDVDILLWIVEVDRWLEDDEAVLELLKKSNMPVILVLNKVDKLESKNALLPIIEERQGMYPFLDVVPLSALKEDNVTRLQAVVSRHLPDGPFMYSEDQLTDRDHLFMFKEIIREKIMRLLGQEVPYSVAVDIELVEEKAKVVRICAVLWVERKGQKAIVIGKGGAQIKKIGQLARVDIEKYLNKKVFLELWVKVKEDWSSDERSLKQLGYE